MPEEGSMEGRVEIVSEGLRGDRQANLKGQVFWRHPNIHSSMPKF